MTTQELKKYKDIKKIIKDLDDEINELKSKSTVDVVKASYDEFPYTQHTLKIYGNDDISLSAIQTLISKKNAKKAELEDLRIQIESFVDNIQDYQIRKILKLKYIEGKSWHTIATKMNMKGESSVRMMCERFLKKL